MLAQLIRQVRSFTLADVRAHPRGRLFVVAAALVTYWALELPWQTTSYAKAWGREPEIATGWEAEPSRWIAFFVILIIAVQLSPLVFRERLAWLLPRRRRDILIGMLAGVLALLALTVFARGADVDRDGGITLTPSWGTFAMLGCAGLLGFAAWRTFDDAGFQGWIRTTSGHVRDAVHDMRRPIVKPDRAAGEEQR
ncbi:MAG TPA: hypothetical protein VIP77_11590 [Jiangellaceae bacterium]